MFDVSSAIRAATARNKERQEELSKEISVNASLLDPNSKEARLNRAKTQEADILCQIEELKWVRGSLKQTRLNQLLDRLSELLAEQGKYRDAFKVAVNPERKAYYKSLIKASEIDDATKCECENEKIYDPIKKRELSVSPEMVLNEVYDEKSDSMKSLVLCRNCGLLNIK